MRGFLPLAVLSLLAALAGCGGGGGGADESKTALTPPATSSSVSFTPNTQSPATSPAVTPQSTLRNSIPVMVDAGPANNINMLFATVTVCAPGSDAKCQQIDHVLVDTGSSGLRLLASEVSPDLALPAQALVPGGPLAECMHFADGYTWGPVKVADVKLADHRASSLPVQIIGDKAFAGVPADCASSGAGHNSLQELGARGILGVGMFLDDCGDLCAYRSDIGLYYTCEGASCTGTAVPTGKQVANPVARFSADNNGVTLKLPALPTTGSVSVAGTLLFGIGTQANNAMGTATVFTAHADTGYIATVYNGQTLPNSFIDSGSNGYFFNDAKISACASGFFCPTLPLTLSAINQGLNGKTKTVSFAIHNADELFTKYPTNAAFANLGGGFSRASSFDWGLPFFYGKTVFTAFENKSTPGGTGPYFAF